MSKARLLTVQELEQSGCATLSGKTSLTSTGTLAACNFLFEGTKYADSSKATFGPWLETPRASNSGSVWYARAYGRSVDFRGAISPYCGARPAIDVAISDIDY